MGLSQRAGKLPTDSDLVDVPALLAAYEDRRPDPSVPEERVRFGTSGHRGSSLRGSFNRAHLEAIVEAVCRYRSAHRIQGPLFIGRDTHALSEPAYRTAVEVLVGHGVEVMVDADEGFTPTPAVSHAILCHNRSARARADGLVVTPSHNPPEDGGIKYNPPDGGPAGTEVTAWIEREANAILVSGLEGVKRVPWQRARRAPTVHRYDYLGTYVADLSDAVDLDGIRGAGLRIGVDPLGGSSLAYWEAIAERYRLELEVVNRRIDPTFSFVPLDWDGRIRMDCSSPYAMAGLVGLRERFDVAVANDPDADRHGVVTPAAGLLPPNHYLSVAVGHLFGLFGDARPWPGAGVGKTVVTTALLDRIAAAAGRRLLEVPVGFKWFVDGLLRGELGFGGEESAGASFLRRRGGAWSTDKDGLILALLAAEMTARWGRDPSELYRRLTGRLGEPVFRRLDAPATAAERAALARLGGDRVAGRELAGEPVAVVLTRASGNGQPIGGIKVVSASAWFAARPSGTEDVYKIYAESFLGPEHLERVVAEAQALVREALSSA